MFLRDAYASLAARTQIRSAFETGLLSLTVGVVIHRLGAIFFITLGGHFLIETFSVPLLLAVSTIQMALKIHKYQEVIQWILRTVHSEIRFLLADYGVAYTHARNGFCFPIDFLTFVPGQSNIP